MLERVDAGVDPRAHHRRNESRALFVRPRHDFERRSRAHACVFERAHHFQAGHDAVGAVELAARRLRVEVAADRHRQEIGVGPRSTREDVADGVDFDRHRCLAAPADEAVAPTAILVAQRQPTDAALRCRADARELHEGVPQPL